MALRVLETYRRGQSPRNDVEYLLWDGRRIFVESIGSKGWQDSLFDDEVLTGGSMMEAIKILKRKGVRRILAGCTHGIFSGEALEWIDQSPVEIFVTTNTIPLPAGKPSRKIEVLSVARLLGEAIKAIHHGESVSRLLDD